MTIEQGIAIASFSLGVGSTLFAIVQWNTQRRAEQAAKIAENTKKSYAAERDFEHLRKNYTQMNEYLKLLGDEVKEQRQDIRNLTQLAQILVSRGEGDISGVLRRTDH